MQFRCLAMALKKIRNLARLGTIHPSVKVQQKPLRQRPIQAILHSCCRFGRCWRFPWTSRVSLLRQHQPSR